MHPVALRVLARLFAGSDPLVIAIQNVAEFWNAATRPLAVNGLGMTIDQVRGEVKRLEGFSEIVSESADSYAAWKALVTTHRVSGAQVHDARLAAVMTASGITRILTFNVRDFIRFAGIEAAHPEQIAEVAGPELSYFSACSSASSCLLESSPCSVRRTGPLGCPKF